MKRSIDSPGTRSSLHSRQAFTLIELLTVIAIIGILAAILIPVVGKVREQGRQAVCRSNLRQIHMAITMYAQDQHNGRIPDMASHWQGWSTHVYHLGRDGRNALMNEYDMPADIFYCPSNPDWGGRRAEFWEGSWEANGRTPIGYAIIAGNEASWSDSSRNDYPRSLEWESQRTEFAADLTVQSGGSFLERTNHFDQSAGLPTGGNVIHIHGNVEWRPFDKMFPGRGGAWQPYW